MKLYDNIYAPNPRRARILIAEKGVKVENIQVDLRAAEQLGDAYKLINPRCTVPTLVLDDGTAITENLAIADYLESAFREPVMMGRTVAARAEVLTWNAICEQDGIAAIAEVFRNEHEAFKGRALVGPVNFDQIPILSERGRARFALFTPRLEDQLAKANYLTGNDFGFADITAFITLEFANMVGMGLDEEALQPYPNINTWLNRVREKSSTQA